MSNELQFSSLSLELTKELSLKSKKDNGIYFTPKSIIKKTIDIIKSIPDYTDTIKFKTILEPSCGSCEFIKYITQEFTNKKLSITAIEFNDIIYQKISKLNFVENTNNTIEFINKDYMTYNNEKMYDLIIGNPPYFVMSKNDIDSNLKEYSNFYDGRPNIFILFIIHSLKKLNIKGILAFVLPKSFINCLYYNKLRKHIYGNYKIIDIIDCLNDDCNEYLETKQETIIFVIQKINQLELKELKELKELNKKYIFEIKDYVIFNTIENIKLINKLYENSTTLDDLGFDVKVGNIVWNQHKDKLTNDETKTLLIYSSNIKNNKLEIVDYDNDEKKKYITLEGKKEPLLVLNRGYGKGKYVFNYCLINSDSEKPYLIENHLICLINKNKKLKKEEIIKKYNELIKSFIDKKTYEFVSLFFGNNAVNTTELKYILPIYI